MPIPESGCYVFIGSIDEHGYGRLGVNGRTIRAHKIAYALLVGPVPEGHELDHKCRVRSCWNPFHLEPVTHRVNMLRGVGPTAANAKKTACDRGHPLDAGNTYIDRSGGRRCRKCNADAARAYRLRRYEHPR